MLAKDGATNQRPWVPSLGTFSSRIALVRHLLGMNVKEAALSCGISPASWRQWEIHGSLPRDVVTVARTIAAHTGADATWIITGEASANALEISKIDDALHEETPPAEAEGVSDDVRLEGLEPPTF